VDCALSHVADRQGGAARRRIETLPKPSRLVRQRLDTAAERPTRRPLFHGRAVPDQSADSPGTYRQTPGSRGVELANSRSTSAVVSGCSSWPTISASGIV